MPLSYNTLKLREAYRLMFADYPDVVGVAELQTMLGVGRKLAYRLLGEGEIQALHVGRTYRIPKVNVIAYLNQRT
jgi:excisionase family DNA binding protein